MRPRKRANRHVEESNDEDDVQEKCSHLQGRRVLRCALEKILDTLIHLRDENELKPHFDFRFDLFEFSCILFR